MNNNNENINNGNDKEKNTVYIKGIYKEIKENELKDFIKKKCPLIEYKDLRLVLDDNGKNKGFAFVDFNSDKEAKLFVDEMNKKK
jgi:RNA recognition motif-containing protein